MMSNLSQHILLWIRDYSIGLLGAWLERAKGDGWLRFQSADGSVIWPEELKGLFDNRLRSMAGQHLGFAALQINQADLWPQFLARLEDRLVEDPCARRWHDLLTRLQLSALEGQLLAWLVSLNLDASLARGWRYAWANLMRDTPTWGFACLLFSGDGLGCDLGPSSALFSTGLVTMQKREAETLRESLAIGLAPEALDWLAGWICTYSEFKSFDDLVSAPARLQKALGPRLRELSKYGGLIRAAVIGPDDASRVSVVDQVALASRVRGGVWTLNLGAAVAQGRGLEAILRARRMAALLDAAVAVTGLERLKDQLWPWVEQVLDVFGVSKSPLIWVTMDDPSEAIEVDPRARFRVGYPNPEQRLSAWRESLDICLNSEHLQRLSAQYLLTEGQIERLAREAVTQDFRSDVALFEHLSAACREVSQQGLGRLAVPESGQASLDQLLVNEETALVLEEIIQSVQNRLKIQALFENKVSYGLQGVTCLFTGPPGTGKTLAARVISSTLGLELYRVDLSQLVDKYIGETEKKLGALFNAAEASGVVLLFDEADSIFGKRTEVKTSVDRYANLEVNYLLQRMEHFGGVVILTTNFEAGIDRARSPNGRLY